MLLVSAASGMRRTPSARHGIGAVPSLRILAEARERLLKVMVRSVRGLRCCDA
jgi:hypothetical protein